MSMVKICTYTFPHFLASDPSSLSSFYAKVNKIMSCLWTRSLGVMREAPLTLYTEVGMILESYVVKKGNIEVIALVFARDRDRSLGTIRFHVALSNGVSTVGPIYKTTSVKSNNADCSTWLIARREGQ